MEGVRGTHLADRVALTLSYFNSPTGNLLGIITASLFLPAIVFSFVGDWLCGRFGRKITIYVGATLIIAGGAWNGMSQDLGQFIACRLMPLILIGSDD